MAAQCILVSSPLLSTSHIHPCPCNHWMSVLLAEQTRIYPVRIYVDRVLHGKVEPGHNHSHMDCSTWAHYSSEISNYSIPKHPHVIPQIDYTDYYSRTGLFLFSIKVLQWTYLTAGMHYYCTCSVSIFTLAMVLLQAYWRSMSCRHVIIIPNR